MYQINIKYRGTWNSGGVLKKILKRILDLNKIFKPIKGENESKVYCLYSSTWNSSVVAQVHEGVGCVTCSSKIAGQQGC